MSTDSPGKALGVVLSVALFCSVLVSVAAISLKPLQERNALIERSRNIVALSGMVPAGKTLSAEEILQVAERLDARIVNLETGLFDDAIDPLDFNSRSASGDPQQSVVVPAEIDLANLGRRAQHELIYLVWGDDDLARVILPIRGQGMWSTLYGFIALENDLNTIGGATFYEQAETAGLGDQITRQSWLDQWAGRQLFTTDGSYRFRVAAGPVDRASMAGAYEVDGLTGASVTANAVTALVGYWFGPHGYQALLEQMRTNPPQRREEH